MSFEDPPRKPTGMVIGENLDLLSVSELEQRLQALKPKWNASGPRCNPNAHRNRRLTPFSAPDISDLGETLR